MEFLESKRGGRTVNCNNFKYNFGFTNKKDDSTPWQYVMRTCNAKLFTDKNDTFTLVVGEHNHDV